MAGQSKSPIVEQFKHVLVVTGDERVQRLLKMPLASILPTTQVDSLDPGQGDSPSLDTIDLIVFGVSQEWNGAKAWIVANSANKLPPMISVDFAARVTAAVEMMRLGVIDYIDSNEMNIDRLTQALMLAAGTVPAAEEVSENIEHTGVVDHVSSGNMTQQAASMAASDETQVSPYLSTPASDETQVSPYLAGTLSGQTEAAAEPQAIDQQVDTEAHTNVFSQVAASPEVPVDDGPDVEATVQLSGDAIRKLQQQHADLVTKESPPPVAKEVDKPVAREVDKKEETGSGFIMGGGDDVDFEVGPHTDHAPHLGSVPQRGQFEVDENFGKKNDDSGKQQAAPFSGAWLRMPDSVGEQAWPFSPEEMEEGTAILGNYRILEFLGVGGMASVFKAQRISDDMLFAIKLLDPNLADDSVRERFVLEFTILQSIQHKHVVQMEEQCDEGQWIYTVMEYLPGGDLKSRIRRRLRREEAVRYASQIAAALGAAHKLGVLHRDLKPANVLFRSNGTLALVDFGVAKDTKSDDKGLTKEGQMVGTPYYASPEQATGAKMDQRSDLYALGVILFEMLEGRRPFVGDTSLQVLMAHVKDPVPLLAQEWDALNDVLTQLLAKSPSDRFPDGKAVVEALNEASPGDVPADLM